MMRSKRKVEEVKIRKRPEEDGGKCFFDVKMHFLRVCVCARMCACVCVCAHVHSCMSFASICATWREGRLAPISHAADPLPSKQLNPLEELSTQGDYCTSKSVSLARNQFTHTEIYTLTQTPTHTHTHTQKGQKRVGYQTHRGGPSGPDGPS